MNIEDDLFEKCEVNIDKLEEYGFRKEEGKYLYTKNILDNKFKIIIEYDNKIKGKIIEVEFNDEYINFRREVIGEFNGNIKQKFIDLLIDIRNKCFSRNNFKNNQTRRISEYINKKYSVNPEFLWEKLPNYAVFRKGKKWFALISSVSKSKVDKTSNIETEVEVINLKVLESIIDDVLSKKGYYEGYHMNKKNWISIILDDTLSDDDIIKMIDDSYKLIAKIR